MNYLDRPNSLEILRYIIDNKYKGVYAILRSILDDWNIDYLSNIINSRNDSNYLITLKDIKHKYRDIYNDIPSSIPIIDESFNYNSSIRCDLIVNSNSFESYDLIIDENSKQYECFYVVISGEISLLGSDLQYQIIKGELVYIPARVDLNYRIVISTNAIIIKYYYDVIESLISIIPNNEELTIVSLVKQLVHNQVIATTSESTTFIIQQRDCVENLVRNLFNICCLYPNGTIRPLNNVSVNSILFLFYNKLSCAERISSHAVISKMWLDSTIGFESFGVQYAQYNREALSGLNNIVSLMEGLINKPHRSSTSINLSNDQVRAYRLIQLCEYLSSPELTISVVFANNKLIQELPNLGDVKLRITTNGMKIKYIIKLYIVEEHVSIRCRNQYSG